MEYNARVRNYKYTLQEGRYVLVVTHECIHILHTALLGVY